MATHILSVILLFYDVTHDCFCYSSRSIPFLDTLVTIKNNTLVTDVYKNPTNCNQILLPSSCHPAHITYVQHTFKYLLQICPYLLF